MNACNPALIDAVDDAEEVLLDDAAAAEVDKDLGKIVQASRAAAQVADMLAKAQPPKQVSADERPETVADAAIVRKKLHDLFDRVLKDRQS